MTRRSSASRRARSERGATTTLVALLFGGFVVTGLLAWSADAGQVFWERRQTQNAADAAAMALAQSCAKSNCVADANNLPALVNANTVNNASRTHTIERQCKRNTTVGTLPVCSSTPSVGDLRECPPVPTGMSSTLPYVEVRVRSNGASPGLIPNLFTRANNGGPDDSTVISCSRAAWGVPGGGTFTSPVTISTCEWQTYTNGGTTWVAQPPVAPWPGYGGAGQPAYPLPATTPTNTPGREVIIKLHDPGAAGCSWNGKDTAGGFGYLDTTGSCSSTLSTVNGTDYWANLDTGASLPAGCKPVMDSIYLNGPVIDLPVFDCLVKSATTPTGGAPADCTPNPPFAGGAKTWYHVAGVAKFYLSGFKLPGATQPSRVSGVVPCTGSDKCISGWFVQGVLNTPATNISPPTPGNGFGITAVLPAG